MKSSVTVTFFFLFLVALGAYLYLIPNEILETGGGKILESQAKQVNVLELADGDSVQSIAIENTANGTVTRLSHEADGWYVTEPFQAKASEIVTRGLVAALTMSPRAKILTPAGSWEDYGLENSGLRIGVATLKSEQERTLSFGGPSATGDFVYARWKDESTLFLVDSALKRVFERSPQAFREKRIFREPLQEIERIRVRTPRGGYEITRTETGWLWLEPVSLLGNEVSKEKVHNLLAQLQDLFVKDFLEQGASKEMGFGLLGEGVHIQLWRAGEVPAGNLEIGKEAAQQDAFYARLSDSNQAFLIAREKVFLFIKTLHETAQAALLESSVL